MAEKQLRKSCPNSDADGLAADLQWAPPSVAQLHCAEYVAVLGTTTVRAAAAKPASPRLGVSWGFSGQIEDELGFDHASTEKRDFTVILVAPINLAT